MRRLFLVAGLTAVPSLAVAAPIISTTGIASPALTITFSELALTANTVVTNQYASFGVTFSPNVFQNPQAVSGPHVDATPNSLSNFSFVPDQSIPQFSILFNVDQTAAAFAMITNTGTSTFEAYLNGVLVESFSTTTFSSNINNFYGFTGITFDEIRVSVGGSNQRGIFDNLQLGTTSTSAVPEPATVALLGAGLAALRYRRRRTR